MSFFLNKNTMSAQRVKVLFSRVLSHNCLSCLLVLRKSGSYFRPCSTCSTACLALRRAQDAFIWSLRTKEREETRVMTDINAPIQRVNCVTCHHGNSFMLVQRVLARAVIVHISNTARYLPNLLIAPAGYLISKPRCLINDIICLAI